MSRGSCSWIVLSLFALLSLFQTRAALAQCASTIEVFDDPRLDAPSLLRSGDPDGDGPLPEELLLVHRIPGEPIRNAQILVGSTRTTLADPIFPQEAIMFQGRWHVLGTFNSSTLTLQRWNGTSFEPTFPLPLGVARPVSMCEFAGELYICLYSSTGRNVIRWNGSRAQIVGTFQDRAGPSRISMMPFNGSLYLGGTFFLMDGVQVRPVVCFTPNGDSWTWTSPTFDVGNWIGTALELGKQGNDLYFLASGNAGSNFFRLNQSTNSWGIVTDAIDPLRGPVGIPSTSLLSVGGYIYAYESSTTLYSYNFTAGVVDGRGFLRWDGTRWQDMSGLANDWKFLATPSSLSSPIPRFIAVPFRGQLAFLANIPRYTSGNETNFAIVLWTGSRFELFSKGLTGQINDIAPYNNGAIVVGRFMFAGGRPVEGTAFWDGQTFHPMGSTPRRGFQPGQQDFLKAHVMNGVPFIGGTFSWSLGEVRYLARWNGSEWVSAINPPSNAPSLVVNLESDGDSLYVGSDPNFNRVHEVVGSQVVRERSLAIGMLKHNNVMYMSNSQTLVMGRRTQGLNVEWITRFPGVLVGPQRMLAHQDEIWAFCSLTPPYPNGYTAPIARLLPNNQLTSAGVLAPPRPFTGIVGTPATFQGDVWWGASHTSQGQARAFARWNGIEWTYPLLQRGSRAISIDFPRGWSAFEMPNQNGTNELWLSTLAPVSASTPVLDALNFRYRASPPPIITLQPVSSAACVGETATFSFATQSSEGVTFAWRFNNIVLTDGLLPGLGEVSGARSPTLTISNLQGITGTIDVLATTNCGTSYSVKVPLTSRRLCCDTTDFNNDSLFPTDEDTLDFLSALAGFACSTNSCNDIDFNNDGLFPDDNDLLAYLSVITGGSCE